MVAPAIATAAAAAAAAATAAAARGKQGIVMKTMKNNEILKLKAGHLKRCADDLLPASRFKLRSFNSMHS